MAENIENTSSLFNTSPTVPKTDPPKKSLFNTAPKRPISQTSKFGMDVHGYNLGIGESKYDEGLTWGTNIDEQDIQGSINEYRANNQSGFTQLGIGVVRAGVKAAAEVAKLPGVIGGVVASPFVEEGQGYDTAFNNSWIKAIDKVTEGINTELLPVYVNKAVKEGNLWDNITSTAFWATEGADGLGFMLGMMAPGAIINKLGVGAKLLGAGKNAAQMLGIAGRTEQAVSALKGMGMTAKSMDVGIGAIVNTISESGAEAASTGNDMDARKGEIVNGYALPKMKQLDDLRRSGQIDETQYNQMSAKISEEAEATFTEQRALAMRDVFKANLGILIIPNLLMSKALFGTAEKGIIKEVEKQGVKGVAQRFGEKAGKRWVGAFASEGLLEEASQSTAQKMFTDKAARGELKRGDEGLLEGIKDFSVGEATDAYLDMVSSNEGLKAIFLGGIMGAPMMSMTGRKEDVEGYKKFEQYKKDKNSILDGLHKNTNNFNTIFANDIYVKDDKGAFVYEKDAEGRNTNKRKIDPVKAMEVAQALNNKEEESKRLEKAIEEGDTDTVEEIKHNALFDMITPAIYNGEAGMDALKEKLAEYNKADEIVAKRNNQKGEMTSSELAKNTMKMAEYLNEQNEKFKDYSSDVIRFDESIPPPIKSAFLNQLNQEYLRTKYDLRNNEAKLKTLEEKRKNMLDEADIHPTLDPLVAKGIDWVEDLGDGLSDAVTGRSKEIKDFLSSKLYTDTNERIKATEASIKKGKKDIAEIWSDVGAEKIAKSLNKFTKTKAKQAQTLSPENADAMQTHIESIRNVDNLKDLKKLAKDPLSQNNPTVEQELATRQIQLEQDEQDRLEAEEAAKKAKAALVQQVEPTDGTELTPIEGLPIPLSGDTTSVQTTNNAETEEDGETPKDTTPKDEVVDQTVVDNTKGSRITSTNQKTGEALPGREAFVDFERTPRDKKNDVVTFDLGAKYNDMQPSTSLAHEIYEKFLETGEISDTDRKHLEKYLPISVTLSNGKMKGSSFIDGYTQHAPHNKIVEQETMPLRKAIVKHLLTNKGSFKDIRGSVKSQFPGQLKVEPRDESGRIVKNDVFDLEVFNGMSEDKKIEYFQKNTSYVNFYGDLVSSLDPKKVIQKDAESNGYIRGEVYLKINRANGTPFQLKMNTAMISEAQSEVLFELMMFRFNDPSQGKDISLRRVLETIEPLNLNKEIDLITKGLDIDEDVNIETLNSLIDLLIFNGNTNHHTQFGMYFTNQTLIGAGKVYTGRTGVKLGAMFDKFVKKDTPEEGTPNEPTTITAEDLNKNGEQLKPFFMEFFQRKRHNILLTNPHFNFKDKAYVKYLLENKITSTNAVVGKGVHQFQGYSNVYLEPSITAKDGKSTEVVEVFGEPKEDKPEVPTTDDHGLTSDAAAIANLEVKLANPAITPFMQKILQGQLDTLKSKLPVTTTQEASDWIKNLPEDVEVEESIVEEIEDVVEKPTEVLETVNNTTVDKAFLNSLSDEQYDSIVKMFMVVKPNEIMTDELIIEIAKDRKMTQEDLKKDCE